MKTIETTIKVDGSGRASIQLAPALCETNLPVVTIQQKSLLNLR